MKSTILTLAALAGFAAAQDLKCLSYAGSSGPCLTSFVWCTNDYVPVCNYAENTNPVAVGSTHVALYRGTKYDLSFNKAWETNSTVSVTWVFPGYNGSDNIRWTTNVSYTGTEGTFVFDPEAILAEFPTPEHNITHAEAIVAAASGLGYLWILPFNLETSPLITQKFVVLDDTTRRIANTANEYARNRRTKELSIGLGVGLGVGLPFVIILTWLIAPPPAWVSRRVKTLKAENTPDGKPPSADELPTEWVPAAQR